MSELETAIDELYALPLRDFIAARADLAKRVRAEHGREVAERVKALPKPSVAAWAVNQLYWHDRRAFDRLTEAGAALRGAQADALSGEGGAQALREAQRAERDVVAKLVGTAAERLRESDQAATAQTLERVEQTLNAIAVSGDWSGPPGRLARELEPPGLDALAALAGSAAHAAEHRATEPRSAHRTAATKEHARGHRAEKAAGDGAAARSVEADRAAQNARRARIERAEEALSNAASELRQTKHRADAARRASDQAETRARARRRDAEEAERRAAQLRAAADDADRRAREARDEVARADKELAQAEAAHESAQVALAKARDSG